LTLKRLRRAVFEFAVLPNAKFRKWGRRDKR
jgi:hypothetical protein